MMETQIIELETAQDLQMGLTIHRCRQESNQKRTRQRRGHRSRTRLPIERSARSATWDSITIQTSPLLSCADIPYAEHVQRI